MLPPSTKRTFSVRTVVREYWAVTRRQPRYIVIFVLGMFMLQAGYILSPIYLSEFITTIAVLEPSADAATRLLVPLFLFAVFEFLAWLGHRIDQYAYARHMPRAVADLTNRAFSYLIRHSYGFFISSFAGSLTRRVIRYAQSYEQLFDSVFFSVIPAIILVLGILAVLSVRNMVLAAVLLVGAVCFVLLQWILIRYQLPLRQKRAEADSNVVAAVADALSNHTTIQLFSKNKEEEERTSEAVSRYRLALERVWFAEFWVYGLLGLAALLINVALLWAGLNLWQKGALAVGDFVLIQMYVFRLMDYVWGLGREFRRIFNAIADGAEMVTIIRMPHEIEDKPGAPALVVGDGTVCFNNVSFRFQDGREVLQDFTLTVRGGEKVALVGPSGAGKTTVTKLLLRLYDVQKGSITIDGQNIADVTQDSLRENIAFVPQEPILFHRTLMENIKYGRKDATEADVIEAAKKAHCHEFIVSLPQDYNTYVGERGIKLSGGERQRIAIARAILKDAPILVLDEATSSLDSESEALIQDALEQLMRGKTVIVIAHRLSTIKKMDRIVVMDRGRIIAEGSHETLLREGGLYQKLWNIQVGGFLGGAEPAPESEEGDGDGGAELLAEEFEEK